jgi:glycosyltransferase involved in cell wall biosynthesis
MKIVYCVGSLISKGGMEKVLANKVNYFIEEKGYEVHIVTQEQKAMSLCYDLDQRVIMHDIEISALNKKIVRGYTFIKNIFALRKIYNSLFDKIKPDIIIVCERGYNDFVIPFTNKDIPKIREFHFAKEAVEIHASLMNRKGRFRHLLMYKLIFRMFNKYDYLVLLTNRDKKNGGYKTKTEVIANMNESSVPKESALLENKNVITVGSMHDDRKRFDIQIKLWEDVVKKHPNWLLNIYGDGTGKEILQNSIDQLKLNKNVILHGSSNTMPKHYLDSSIFLFTSSAEGLPMVLIESLSYGVPCVSFDCPTGPSDIITNDVDGYVVENGNVESLKEKLFKLIEDSELRKAMGINAKKNAARYETDNIAKQWTSLFSKIKNDK